MPARKLPIVVLAALAVSALGCQITLGDWEGRCGVTEERSADADAAGARRVEIDAGAGELIVHGVAGATRVSAHGTACANRREVLERIRLEVTRSGDVVHVRTLFPRSTRGPAQLDLTVELPADLPVTAVDGSGLVEVDGVAALTLDDGSGEVRVRDVPGAVEIEDGSGEVDVSGIGSLRISDGSGEIEARNVVGDVVVVSDGSGDIEITGVGGSVTVERDGSGDIRVRTVGGDLTVRRDGSGGVDADGVEGDVKLP